MNVNYHKLAGTGWRDLLCSFCCSV